MFILSEDLEQDHVGVLKRYNQYIEDNQSRFTKNVYDLVSSNWYFYGNNPRSPQGGRLIKFMMVEKEKKRKLGKPIDRSDEDLKNLFGSDSVHFQIRVLNALADGMIELVYLNVKEYKITAQDVNRGHWDWRCDEFRISEDGFMLHEIQWGQDHSSANAHWQIIAEDISYKWVDL